MFGFGKMMGSLKLVRIAWLRTYRSFHWFPKIYRGINGVTTDLLVIGYLGFEYE